MLLQCALCQQKVWYRLANHGYAPVLCIICVAKTIGAARRDGTDPRYVVVPCTFCEKPTIHLKTGLHPACCDKCREERRLANIPVDTAKRDKRYEQALLLLSQQRNAGEYVKPLAHIKRQLYRPGWWNSSLEISVAAELGRLGLKLTPQKAIDHYRVDFYIKSLNLIFEVDGSLFHTGRRKNQDKVRDAELLLAGYRVTRVREVAIKDDLRKAVQEAINAAKDAHSLTASDELAAWKKRQERALRREEQANRGVKVFNVASEDKTNRWPRAKRR